MTSDPTKSCLVLGAHGFIGARIVAEFAAAGYAVTGLDRSPASPRDDEALGSRRHEQMSLPSPRLPALLAELRPTVVVNAAGPASVAGSLADPPGDFHGSVGGLLGVLDAVRKARTASRVVTVSSAAVYGNPALLPVREDAPLLPMSPYGFHKEIAETLLLEYYDTFGVASCAARVFSAYGPGLRRQLLWDVCRKALSGPVVELSGTGEETRDFLHVVDVARAIRLLAERARMRAEAYNVASGTETSVADLARRLVAHVSPSAVVEFSGVQRPGDPLRWQADISAIARLGFVPSVSLDQGLAEYALWCAREASV